MQLLNSLWNLWGNIQNFFQTLPLIALFVAFAGGVAYSLSKTSLFLIVAAGAAFGYWSFSGDPNVDYWAIGTPLAGMVVGGILNGFVKKSGWFGFAVLAGAAYFAVDGQDVAAGLTLAIGVAAWGLRHGMKGIGDPLGPIFTLGQGGGGKEGGHH